MPFAVIETGGKQYLISPKDKIKVEKLLAEAGKEITFDKVLLMQDKETRVGKPYVSDAKVVGKVLKQGRTRKLKILKYKSKVRYRRRLGHRQQFTEVEIMSISGRK
ncbi:MAG: 50S ribosomal protein L21 [Candidatus Doudnabacteria bacterium]|nr:50S ribosomal protein L21 [Candidatus Doudnabacteria bacterium]